MRADYSVVLTPQGPGIFFIIPCIDTYKKVDLRTVSFDVPPQEVRDCFPKCFKSFNYKISLRRC